MAWWYFCSRAGVAQGAASLTTATEHLQVYTSPGPDDFALSGTQSSNFWNLFDLLQSHLNAPSLLISFEPLLLLLLSSTAQALFAFIYQFPAGRSRSFFERFLICINLHLNSSDTTTATLPHYRNTTLTSLAVGLPASRGRLSLFPYSLSSLSLSLAHFSPPSPSPSLLWTWAPKV